MMEAIGRLFNVVPTAAGVEVDLVNAEAVTFVCVGDEDYTLREAQDGVGTGVQDLQAIARVIEGSADGSQAWTVRDQLPGAVVNPSGTNTVAVFSTATGLVTAIVHDLAVQRDPALLGPLTG